MAVAFECITRSHRSVEELFDRARDIGLHERSQARAREAAVGGVTTGLIGPGESVTWRASHFGVPFTLTSTVTAFEAPRRFVDEQSRGPFRWFRHEHLVEPLGETRDQRDDQPRSGGSVMTDRVSFAAGFGVLGLVVERLLLAPHLRRLIVERGRFLAD